MKIVVAVIQPYRLEHVKEALYKADVHLMTVSEVLGHGRQKGVTEVYRAQRETGNLLRKLRLEIAVNDDFVKITVDAIIKAAQSGHIGDGKIFIMPMDECIRIRTRETGSAAIG